MSDQPPSDVLGALPRRRPQRRSDKRASGIAPDKTPTKVRARIARPKQPPRTTAEREPAPADRNPASPEGKPPAPRTTARRQPERLRQPAQPPGIPNVPRGPRPVQPNGRHILETAAQAAAELAEIGLAVGARALRNAVGRLPRP